MSEEGGSLAAKTEKGPRVFFLTMAEEDERVVGWEKARSLLPSRHSAFSAIGGNYRLASAFFTQ